jgi:hypothetical protein
MLEWIIVIILLSTIPYITGIFMAPNGGRFTGNLISCYDTFSYFADMQLGAQGYWLYGLPYSVEPNQPAPLFMLYILMGHLSRILQLPIPFVFHLGRILFSAVFLLAAAKVILYCLDGEKEQKLAFGILLFTGGIGWLPIIISGGTATQEFTPDLWWVEAISFNSMMSMPHFVLSMAVMIWILLSGERFIHEARWKDGIQVGIAGIMMALIHPQQIVTLGLVLIVLLIRYWFKETKVMIGRSLSLFLYLLPGLVLTAYSTMISLRDPLLSSWLSQGNTYSPPFWSLLILYGPVFLFALFGIWRWLKDRNLKLLAPALWFIVVLFLIFVPVNFQRRFAEGWHLPVSILASAGWYRFLAPFFEKTSPRFAQALLIIMLICVGISPLFVFSATISRLIGVDPGTVACTYDNGDEKNAMAFLQQHGRSDSIVLSDLMYGVKIPAETGLRTVIGHETLTPFFVERMEEVDEFFNPSTDPNTKKDILQKLGVDYIFVTTEEGNLDFLQDTGDFILIYDNNSFLIYQVE